MESTLDKLVKEQGTVITDEELKNITVSDKKMEQIKELIASSFAYADNSPIPGQAVEFNTSLNETKEAAMNALYQQATTINAIEKAKKESEEETKQKQITKQQFVDAMLYQQGEMYYEKYHHMMDGQTKRRIRKMIERDYDSNKYNNGTYFKVPKQKQIIKKVKNTKPVNISDMITKSL